MVPLLMMVIVKCYPRLEGNMGENVFKTEDCVGGGATMSFCVFFLTLPTLTERPVIVEVLRRL